jgi:cation-transporting ATPase E
VAVLVAGGIALENLLRISRPLNLVRKALVSAMVGLFVLAFVVPFGRSTFDLPLTAAWAYAVAAAIVAAAYPVLALGSRVAEHYRDRIG